MLTKSGAASATGLILLSAFSWISTLPVFIVASHLLIIAFCLEYFYFKIQARILRQIVIQRTISTERLFVGQRIMVQITLKSKHRLGRVVCYIEDKPPSTFQLITGSNQAHVDVKPRSTTFLTYELEALENGAFTLGPIWAYLFDPLMLFWTIRNYNTVNSLKVFPRISSQSSIVVHAGIFSTSSHGDRPIRQAGMGSEFYEIREYSPGDDFRSIAWKAMARSPDHRPMTEKQESEKRAEVVIMIHNTSSMEEGSPGRRKIAAAVEAAQSLVCNAIREGDTIVLVYLDESSRLRVHRCLGRDPVVESIYLLYDLKPKSSKPVGDCLQYLSKQLKSKSNIFIITDLNLDVSLDPSPVKALQIRGHQISLFLTPTMPFIILHQEFSYAARYAYKILMQLEIKEFMQLAQDLRKEGIYTEVCGPEELEKKMLSRYINLKMAE